MTFFYKPLPKQKAKALSLLSPEALNPKTLTLNPEP